MITPEQKKLMYWHSRRGMLELDLIMVPFFENNFDSLSEDDQLLYAELLKCEDQDLFRWFLKRELPDEPGLRRIVTLISGNV